MKIDKLVVTRQPGVFQFLVDHGYVDKDTDQISFAKIHDVRGKHVFGLLPTWLSCKAELYTEVQFKVPPELRGKEITGDKIGFYINDVRTYEVREVQNGNS